MITFGAGDVYIKSGTTQVRVGEVQEVGLEFSDEKVQHYGSSRYALMTAVTKSSITGTAKQAKFQGALISALLGGAYTDGTTIGATETMTSAGTTATATNVTGFSDLGVWTTSGIPLDPVASAPAAGEYSVTAAGVYTFGTSGTYRFAYSYTAATGKTVKVTNQTMGLAPTFELRLFNTAPDGKKMGIKLFAATFDKLSLAFKTSEFTAPDLSFSAAQNDAGEVFEAYFPDAE